jgi:hypothetical protein
MGKIDHAAWLQVLAASDVFLLPSEYEGISIALLESMGMGVVPVTASVGGQDEVVKPDCGFLIPHSEQELTVYVETLGRLITDKTLRTTIGASARKQIFEHFNLPTTTSYLLERLERAHQLIASQPRVTLPLGFAQEVANQAVEQTRITNVANVLWSTQAGAAGQASPATLRHLYILLSRTLIGRAILHSKFLRKCGRWLINRLEK